MASTRSLQGLTEVAEDVARAIAAINQLRRGKNGAQIAKLAEILERRVRNIVAGRMRRSRQASRRPRDIGGRFAQS